MAEILETDYNGALTIPAELLAENRSGARFCVERKGDALQIVPEDATDQPTNGHTEWMLKWRDLADRIGKASTTDRSAVDILSEMRR